MKALITRFGGNVTDVDEWGKRRFAYEIQKMKEGFYYFVHFEAEAYSSGRSRTAYPHHGQRTQIFMREDRKHKRKEVYMNKAVLVGRLTRDPEVRYSQGDNATAVARYTVAVDRRFKRDGEPTADFIPCVVFGRSAEFAEKYFRQGMRVSVSGRIQTGSYTNKDGMKVYTTEVIVEEQEFAESRAESEANRGIVSAVCTESGAERCRQETDL